ncbi:unnamed protein product [Phyllotreta striolata]|uniref:Uncharacterized protein n=1 Tax=Phyllotreta striolata TaxID=444603 RepID=A0A9N9TTP7_PHYSR|nr:unnamed protein product [Phyllotreta striolata]
MAKSDAVQVDKSALIAQQLEWIRLISGNEEKARLKGLKNLGKWLLMRSAAMPFTEFDFQRIWKGLYYCMWMADKPLVQEDCAEKISKLVHFPDVPTALIFFKAGLQILANEWSGIQQLRLDKFLMLVRRLFRETFSVLRNNKFKKNHIEGFAEILSDTILNQANNTPVGLFMHVVEVYLEELAKVSQGKVQPNQVLDLTRPFMKYLSSCNDGRQIGHLRKFIFTYLIRQSKLGLDYQERYEAWRQQGFPGNIDSMQKIKIDKNSDDNEDDEENEDEPKEKPLDPRAGRVDVEIPQLNFKPQDVANALLEYKFEANTSNRSRAMIKTLAKQFTSLANGVYPLGIKKIQADANDLNIRKAAKELIKFEQKIMGKNAKKRKHDKENDVISENKRQKLSDCNEKNQQKKKKKNRNKNQKASEETTTDIEHSTIKTEMIEKKNKVKVGIEKKNKIRTVKKSNEIKSKSKLKDLQIALTRIKQAPSETLECVLKRNSGTWFVYELDEPKAPDTRSMTLTQSEEIPAVEKEFTLSPSGKSNEGNSPKKPSETPNPLFPKSAWEEPLQEGEYEYFVTSKKPKSPPASDKNVKDMIESTLKRIKGKSKLSLDSRLIENPFAKPSSAKKVKINTKLNRSQEIQEHYVRVRSSPGIPFDASRRPAKPLLKSGAASSPINPFYKRKSFLKKRSV